MTHAELFNKFIETHTKSMNFYDDEFLKKIMDSTDWMLNRYPEGEISEYVVELEQAVAMIWAIVQKAKKGDIKA